MATSTRDDFDGYRKWLGITTKNRTPTHYELLAISLDEEDPDVIQAAAEQRRHYVESKRGEGHDDLVTEIVYRINEAESTMLNVALRRDYDRKLNLFEKRQKSRQYDPTAPRSRFKSRPGRTVGEDGGIVKTFVAIMAIVCVGFGGMAWLSFGLPWNKPAKQVVVQDQPPVAEPPQALPAAVSEQQEPIKPVVADPPMNEPDKPKIPAAPNKHAAGAVVFQDHSYKAFLEVLSWHQAKSRCEEMGGHLPIIETDAENSFVADLAQKIIVKPDQLNGVWLGATDERKEGEWEWINGDKLTFTKWNPGQPNNKQSAEHYLLLWLLKSEWADQPNDSKQHPAYLVCEWDSVVVPDDSIVPVQPVDVTKPPVVQNEHLAGATIYKGHNYKVFREAGVDWKTAKARCEAMGGHLVTISDEQENKFITTLATKTLGDINNSGIWLGATDESKEGQWEWVDGTPFKFSAWFGDQPNGKRDENYLLLLLYFRGQNGNESRGWCDQPNAGKVHVIYYACEWDSIESEKPKDAMDVPIGSWIEKRPDAPGGDRIRTFEGDGTFTISSPKVEQKLVGTWRRDGSRVYFSHPAATPQEEPTVDKWFEIARSDDQKMTIRMMGQREYIWQKTVPQKDATSEGLNTTVSLLDGKLLDVWQPLKKSDDISNWSLSDGVLTMTAAGPPLRTKQTFRDFDLRLEFKLPPNCNTGVFLRGRYEVQLVDSQVRKSDGKPFDPVQKCGAIYGQIAPSQDTYRGANKWNTLDVRLVGETVTVRVNDTLIIDAKEINGPTSGSFNDDEEADPGPIFLQSHTVTGMSFRNIKITPLAESAEPPIEDAKAKVMKALQGDWKCTYSEQIGGVADKKGLKESDRRVTIEGNSYSMKRTQGDKRSGYSGKFEINPANGHFDWVGEGPGGGLTKWIGIFELDGDTLKVCYRYNEDGKAERPTKFKTDASKKNPSAFYTFKRDND